jgi:pyrroline-5-carboxylate reductase
MPVTLKNPLVLVGAGKMGGALLAGWLKSGVSPTQIIVRDPTPAPETAQLIAREGIALNFSVDEIAARAPEVVVLAVKPQLFANVLPELKPLASSSPLFLSIAAGIGLAKIEDLIGADIAAVRAMPNTPASVGRGMSAAFANARTSSAQRALAGELLAAVGETGWVEDEALIDAVTAISGSGPAYIFYLVECLAGAGERLGLPPELALKLARETVSGAGEMLHQLDETPAQLRKNVTSPGGTTAAALDVLMGENGLMQVMQRATAAARDRARELGK